MKIIAISDTHNMQKYIKLIPEGDVVVHAGDSTMRGTVKEISEFAEWYGKLNFKHKVAISGNHDFGFQNANRETVENIMAENGITYLKDSGAEIEGIKFWGAPWQPWFHSWAFNLHRGNEIAEKWNLIPEDTNILITHGPPYGILDVTETGETVGCEALTERIKSLKNLKYHIFGHIHESYGAVERNGVVYVNACTCTRNYTPTNKPVMIEM